MYQHYICKKKISKNRQNEVNILKIFNMINFNNSTFFYEPFPHSTLHNVIEESDYNKICSEFPETNLLNKMQDKRKDEKKIF